MNFKRAIISVLALTVMTSAVAPVQAGGDTLVVIATVDEIPGDFPPNDLYNYVYIMKYKILKVEKGTYDNWTLFGSNNVMRIGPDDVFGLLGPQPFASVVETSNVKCGG